MQPPARPRKPPEKPPQTGSFLPILLAGCLASLVGVALLFLTMGIAGPIAAVGGIMIGVVAFHYLVWGRWLSAGIRADVEAEQRRRAENALSKDPAPQVEPHGEST